MNSERLTRLHNFFRHVVTATSNVSLYSAEHQQVKDLCARSLANFAEAVGMGSDISLMVIDDELIHDGSRLGSSMYVTRFAQLLTARGIGNIRISSHITPEEMLAFLVIFSNKFVRDSFIY